MKILVTGAAGYLGGRIAEFFLMAGNEVVIATRDSTQKNISPGIEVKKVQWDTPSSISALCSGVDVILHAAGLNAVESYKDPVKALEINGVVTARLVESAVLQNVPKFIFLSTAHVYASPLVGIISEKTCPSNLHPYATSNRAGEDAVLQAMLKNDIKAVVLRLSNVIGKPVNKEVECWKLVVNDLCKQAVTTKKMFINGTGLDQRNFIPIKDVERFIQYLIDGDDNFWKLKIFNIGGEKTFTILEIAQLIRDRCKKLFGIVVSIECASNKMNRNVNFNFKLLNLKYIKFEHKSEITNEIDDLLNFCKMSFT